MKAEYIICPKNLTSTKHPSIFLAGGITNCPDWQSEVLKTELGEMPVFLLNPRRKEFDTKNAALSEWQIEWEYRHLWKADVVMFWFCQETVQPITLFELGAQSKGTKPLFVGAHPNYSRRLDIVEQLKLARPEVEVKDSLEAVCSEVKNWLLQNHF